MTDLAADLQFRRSPLVVGCRRFSPPRPIRGPRLDDEHGEFVPIAKGRGDFASFDCRVWLLP